MALLLQVTVLVVLAALAGQCSMQKVGRWKIS